MKNYLRLGYSEDGKTVYFVFYDVDASLVDEVLTNRQVNFDTAKIFTKPGEIYELFSVCVDSAEEKNFMEAMEDMKTKRLFMGYRDYIHHSGSLVAELKMLIQEAAEETGLVELPSGEKIAAGALN